MISDVKYLAQDVGGGLRLRGGRGEEERAGQGAALPGLLLEAQLPQEAQRGECFPVAKQAMLFCRSMGGYSECLNSVILQRS